MNVNQNVTYTFLTEINGEPANTDQLAIVQIVRLGIVTSLIPSVTILESGAYSFSFTVPSNWNEGDAIQAIITANISQRQVRNIMCLGTVNTPVSDSVHLALATKNPNPISAGSPESKINHAATIID